MNAMLKDEQPEVTIQDLARGVLVQCDGDQEIAVGALSALVMDRYVDTLVSPLVLEACRQAVQQTMRQERRNIWRGATSTKDRIVAAAESCLLDFLLPNTYVRLRDAGKAELVDAVDFYKSRASDATGKYRWLNLIRSQLTADTVGEQFDEAALLLLKETAAK